MEVQALDILELIRLCAGSARAIIGASIVVMWKTFADAVMNAPLIKDLLTSHMPPCNNKQLVHPWRG